MLYWTSIYNRKLTERVLGNAAFSKQIVEIFENRDGGPFESEEKDGDDLGEYLDHKLRDEGLDMLAKH
jgi:hypothetical protein